MDRWQVAVWCLLVVCSAGCRSQQTLDWSQLLQEYGGSGTLSAAEAPVTPNVSAPRGNASPAPEMPDVSLLPAAAGALPSAAAPSNGDPDGAGPSERRIQAGAILQVNVVEDPVLNGKYEVSSIGGISLGYLGPVLLYSMTEREAAEKIQRLLESREFRNATVSVEILRSLYDTIRVEGEHVQSGTIKIGSGDEVALRNILMRVGGLQAAPEDTSVTIIRGGMQSLFPSTLPTEVYRLVKPDGTPYVPDVMVRNYDIVQVNRYDPEAASNGGKTRRTRPLSSVVLVLGEVNRQGFYQFKPGEGFTMMNLVFRMGGLPVYANDKAVRVIRRNATGIDEEFRVNVREIMKEGDPDLDFALAHGDRIIVPARRISLF